MKRQKRNGFIDVLRGLTVISMVVYHAMWDLIYLFGEQSGMAVHKGWYAGLPGFVWQQSICWSFILISGYCVAYSRNPMKRGLIVSACGIVVSVVTSLFTPEARILFGVLTFLGAAQILYGFINKLTAGKNTMSGLVSLCLCVIAFLLTRNINHHALGFGAFNLCRLPDALYVNLFTAFIGFPPVGFVSADYFSLLPWVFLFGAGVCLRRILDVRVPADTGDFPNCNTSRADTGDGSAVQCFRAQRTVLCVGPSVGPCVFLSLIGRHSLIIYMLHQAVIYGVLSILF